MIKSIWGDEFNIEETPIKNKQLLNKLSKPKNTELTEKNLKSKTLDIEDRLNIINTNVLRILGKQKDNILVIRDRQTLTNYIDKAIKYGRIAIDTETNNSLDPLTCKLMGPCIYTKGEKQVYIPLHHIDYRTGKLLPNQLTENDVKEEFQRLIDANTKIIMHNGKFDYKVIHCTCDIDLPIYWDTMIAARLIDENEPSAGLKQQYIDKIDPEQEKYDIEHLFENVEYAQVDPEIFAMYAATDALMTDRLYEWQVEEFKDPSLNGVYNIFMNIEMPLTIVVAKMELEGIGVDLEYAERLSKKYHNLSDECNVKINQEMDKILPLIKEWELSPEANEKSKSKTGKLATKSKKDQLDNPIKLDSPTQLAILVYDILKSPQVSTKSPRGTGVDELTALYRKTNNKLFELMLEKRTLDKLLNTFIDKLPKDINPKDNKIHCQFNSLGTDTGRFSSSSPNLQQIPRANIEIKPMFRAPDNYSLVMCDLSAAEVRTAANAAKDPDMMEAYRQGQDLYSVVASKIYNNNYEDNLEFYPAGTKIMYEGKEIITGNKTHTNKAGKTRRQDSKSVLIGLIYGRGVTSICDQINETRIKKGGEQITKEDAQKLVDNIYKSFPRLKEWIDETHDFVHKNGYIDEVFGRRRRLPDAMLPKYSITPIEGKNLSNFNPLIGCSDKVDETLITKYKNQLNNLRSKSDYETIKKNALNDGLEIHDNTGYISQAERQAVNFQAQAASSEINKLSMIAIDKDPRLKKLGFQLLLTIHDEVIGQCPSENAEEVAKIIPEIMTTVGGDKMCVPLKADSGIVRHWYEDDLLASINENYSKLVKEKNMPEEEAINKIVNEHTELLPSQITKVLKGEVDYLWDNKPNTV